MSRGMKKAATGFLAACMLFALCVAALPLSVKAAAVLPQPAATIDYQNLAFAGLVPGAEYRILDQEATANAAGQIPVDDSFHGLTATIIRLGDGAATADSAPQTLPVPEQPAFPRPMGQNASAADASDGQITRVDDTMEWRVVGTGQIMGWTGCTGTSVDNLSPGLYQVRYKGTATAFASKGTQVRIAAGTDSNIALTVSDVAFPGLIPGGTNPPSKTMTIYNSGSTAYNAGGVGSFVSVDTSLINSFTVDPGDSETFQIGIVMDQIFPGIYGPYVTFGGSENGVDAGVGGINHEMLPTAPTVDTNPVDQTVAAGETANFSVAGSGATAPLKYQWQVDTTGEGGYVDIPGATEATYTTPAATTAMNGYSYRALVMSHDETGYAGRTASAAASLTVKAGPAVTGLTPATSSLEAGGGAVPFTVTGTNLTDAVRVAAFDASGAMVGTADAAAATQGNATSRTGSLTLPACGSTEAQDYTVKVSVDGGANWLASPTAAVRVAGVAVIAPDAITALAENNKIEAPAKVVVGREFTFTATGDRQGAEGVQPGDERYVPVRWSVNPTGAFPAAAPYRASAVIGESGNHTLQAVFSLQRWDGSGWVDTGVTDTKSVAISASAAGTARPGDSATPLVWVVVLGASAAALCLVALLRRRSSSAQ